MLTHYNPPTDPYLDIIYHDDDLIILNKPNGLLSVPGKHPMLGDSLETRVQRTLPTATIVHRLDMATSGVLCMALNKAAHRHISRQFQLRETKKRYIARVWGKMSATTGEVDLPLKCDWPNRPKQMVDFEQGKSAQTLWQVLSSENLPCGNVASTVALTPITGRSHQLRVHMLSEGNVILGDKFYAHPAAFNAASRLQLHAEFLSLTHPTTKQWLEFHSPCPF